MTGSRSGTGVDPRSHSGAPRPKRWVERFARGLTVGLVLFLQATVAGAQTATTGSLSGTVRGSDGFALEGIEVTLTRPGEGWEQVVRVSREGRFLASLLVPGEYDAHVERFGYVPVEVRGIEIRSGRQAVVELRLRAAEPPVTEVDRVSFAAVGRERALSLGRPLSRRDVRRIPHQGRELAGILSRWSLAGAGQEVQGLPGRYTLVEVDGLRHAPAVHPALGPGSLHLTALPTAFLQDVELVTQGVDVEWGPTPGGMLRATTVRGSDRLELEAWGTATGAPLGSEDPLGTSLSSAYGPEAGVLVRGPIRPDTVHFAVGLQGRREARPLSPFAASFGAGAEGFRELAGLGTSQPETWSVLSGFGRVDWRLAPGRSLMFRSNVGLVRGDEGGHDPILSPNGLEGSDVDLGAAFLTQVGERGVFELRAGMESSGRKYGNGLTFPRSWIHEGGIVAGADPMVPGDFESRAIRFVSVVQHAFDRHQLKVGALVSSHRYREEATRAPAGGFVFPDLAAFEQERGLRIRTSGPARESEVRSLEAGVFMQNRWSPSEDLTVTGGLRIDGEVLPWDEVVPSGAWEARTGVDRAEERSSRARFAPRLAVEWTPSPGGPWLVRGSTGLYHGRVDPGLMAEMLADSGAVRVQRTLGRTGGWPEGSPASGATSEGAFLTVMGPRFDAPRTRSSEMALYRDLDGGARLHLGVAQRRTEFLPRRRDLNRSPSRYAHDQFGRELFGQVVREEGVVSILPGSDRRFPEFDVVSAIESDGWSEWWGVTAGVAFADERERRLEARYTFSRTRDNLPGFGDGWPQATHGRPATGGADPGWVEGRSDLDTPHRLALTGSLPLPVGRDVRLGALYAFQTGTPFTPGVRDALHGSDPLGWMHVAPITIPAELEGEVAPLASRWSCLRRLELERNTCRTEGTHEVNLRVDAAIHEATRWDLRLTVEALNLLDSGRVIPDPALFVVDGTGSSDLSPTGGVVELPVHVNEAFGEPLLRLSSGRTLRIGLEVRH